jgi:hypothetical protein
MRFGLLAALLLNLIGPAALAQTPARGSAINLPLLGRLIGSGNTLFRTAVDVTNNTASPVRIDFYLDGVDNATGQRVVANGSINSSGGISAWGQGGQVRARFNAHFDDFVEALIQAGRLPDTLRANGFLGSVLFVFDGRDRIGQAAVTARFYNAFGGGHVGVSLKGREITTNEPQRLVAAVLDTRGNSSGAPPMYPNLFVNNTGIAAGGSQETAGPVTVEITAISNTSGQPIGTPIVLNDLQPGRTVVIGSVLNALQIPTTLERSILLFVRVTSGNAAIQGVISQVDDVTRDGSVFEMSRADF